VPSSTAPAPVTSTVKDLGQGTAMVSSVGEYERFITVAAGDLERVLTLFGGQPGDDVLVLLARDWTGSRSYDFERLLSRARKGACRARRG
jgi:hypothetical protein